MARDTIFICHATPEDNDFARWLGARLTGHGYKVWADMFGLKGGTPFWTTIEEALREHACKVIYVASRTSVDPTREGVRNELSVADSMRKGLKDKAFTIPVRIDDVPFQDFPIWVHQLNGLDFSRSWGDGLVALLDTLESAAVPRTDDDQTGEFERWRQEAVKTAALISTEPEPVLTSLSSIEALPARIRYLKCNTDAEATAKVLREAGIPASLYYQLIITFADVDEVNAALPVPMAVSLRAETTLEQFLTGHVTDVTTPRRADASNIVTALLRQHVERHLLERGLQILPQKGSGAFYFPDGLILNNKVQYTAASGRRTYKQVVGRSERNRVHWHLAMKVTVALGPPAFVRFKPYVAFSDDGQAAIADPKRTSPIRRRFCKNWWNAHWRQLQEAFAVWLADGASSARIQLNGSQELVIAGRLLQLTAERHIVGDLQFQDDPEEPTEPEEDSEELFDPEPDVDDEPEEANA